MESTDGRRVSIAARNDDRFFDSYVKVYPETRIAVNPACDDLCTQTFPTVRSRSGMKSSGAISGSFARAGSRLLKNYRNRFSRLHVPFAPRAAAAH